MNCRWCCFRGLVVPQAEESFWSAGRSFSFRSWERRNYGVEVLQRFYSAVETDLSTTCRWQWTDRNAGEIISIFFSFQSFCSRRSNVRICLQKSLMEKLTDTSVFPFMFRFPAEAPLSVSLCSRYEDDPKTACGIHYYVKIWVGDREFDNPHRR